VKSGEPTGVQPIAASGSSARASLVLDDVFTGWRSQYGNLVGKTKDTAIERFGDRFTQEIPGLLSWRMSEATGTRAIDVGLTTADANGVIFLVKVHAADGEILDPLEVLKRAPLFNFESGTYIDSANNYFIATTKDGRNGFQFSVSDSAVTFEAAVFEDPEIRVKSPRAR